MSENEQVDLGVGELIDTERLRMEEERQYDQDLLDWATKGMSDVYDENGMRRETRRVSVTGERKAHSGQKSSGRSRSPHGEDSKFIKVMAHRRERHGVRQELEGFRGMDTVIAEEIEENMPQDFGGKKRDDLKVHEGLVRKWKEDPNKPEMVAGERLAEGGQVGRRPLQPSSVPSSVEQQLSDLEKARTRGEDRVTRKRRVRHFTGREDAA